MSQKRPPSARSDISEMDIDRTESEIAKLQRQCKIAERDQQAYHKDTREKSCKQQQEIEKLKKELEELHQNHEVSMKYVQEQQAHKDPQSPQTPFYQDIVEEFEREKEQAYDLQKKIGNLDSQVAELSKWIITTIDPSEAQKTHQAIHILENRLERVSTCFGEQITKNNHLKEKLQTCYMRRTNFQQLYNELYMELQEIYKNWRLISTESISAYSGRMDALSKMTMVTEKAVKDRAQFNADIIELERVIAHEFSLKEFMSTKCKERIWQDEHKTSPRRELREQKRMDSRDEPLDALEEYFERIQTVTGEDNPDLQSTRFIQQEDRNFALFNFVNEQSNEAEPLRDQINHIQEEIEQFQLESLKLEQDHCSLIQDNKEQQQETESKGQDYENKVNTIGKILDEIKTVLNSILSTLECDRSVIEDKLGSSPGITDNNIMSYLALVEQKTDRLLILQVLLKDCDPKEQTRFLMGKNLEPLQQNNQVSIHSVQYNTEESPSTDEDKRPLSETELRRLLKGSAE